VERANLSSSNNEATAGPPLNERIGSQHQFGDFSLSQMK
jgi:hypothetical protein